MHVALVATRYDVHTGMAVGAQYFTQRVDQVLADAATTMIGVDVDMQVGRIDRALSRKNAEIIQRREPMRRCRINPATDKISNNVRGICAFGSGQRHQREIAIVAKILIEPQVLESACGLRGVRPAGGGLAKDATNPRDQCGTVTTCSLKVDQPMQCNATA